MYLFNKGVGKVLMAFLCVSILFMNVTTLTCYAEELTEETTNIEQTGGYIDPNAPKVAYIFIGDSRTVGMNNYVHVDALPNVYVIAKVAKGYDWLVQSAIPELNMIKQTTNYDKYIVICNLGVNDLGNISNYIATLPQLMAEDTRLYWVSVNPTIDNLTRVQCSSIELFNAQLQPYFQDMNWIDTYSCLKQVGFKARDGLHYDADTYTLIFSLIMQSVVMNEYVRENPMPPTPTTP